MKNFHFEGLGKSRLSLHILLLGLLIFIAPHTASAVFSSDPVAETPAVELMDALADPNPHFLGNDHTQDGGFKDLHNPGLFINETDTYLNKGSVVTNDPAGQYAQKITISRFNFYASKEGNPVTPVVVKVDGDNDFTVLAVGQTRTNAEYDVGANDFPFASPLPVITLQPGDKIATGFIDADANGKNWGQGGNPIPADQNGSMGLKTVATHLDQDEVWALLPQPLIGFDPGAQDYQAYDPNIDTPAVVVGQKILTTNQGKDVQEYNLLRSYQYSIKFESETLFQGATVYPNKNQGGTPVVFSDGISQLAGTSVEGQASSIHVEEGYVAYLCYKLTDDANASNDETEVCKMHTPGDTDDFFAEDNKATFIKVDQNDPAKHGRWGDVIELPQRAIASAQTPDGRVLFWQGGQPVGAGNGISIIDPKTMIIGDTGAPANHDTFCPGPALMNDGSLILAGGGRGTIDPTNGEVYEDASSIFEWDKTSSTGSWVRTENMQEPHYYGTSVTLPSNEVFHALGSTVAANDWEEQSDNPEMWNGVSWEKLTGLDISPLHASNGFYNSNYYPYLHLMPNSNLFHSGGVPTMHEINPTAQKIYNQGVRAENDDYRHWGNAIMIDEGIIFISGGRSDKTESRKTTVLVDVNDELNIISEYAAPMGYDRAFHDMVQLPTGDVFVSGGQSSGKIFVDYGTVYPTELWDRQTNTWTEMAELTTPRNYHSTSLLLPDGRVWQAGGDCEHCGTNNYPAEKSFKHHYNLQFYSPPYLFNPDGTSATRPVITSAPVGENGVKASQSFNVTVTDATPNIDISATTFNIIKMSSVTHQTNTDVRRLELEATHNGGGQFTLQAHDNINVMTPGFWMLFAVNENGVPAEAAIVHVSSEPGTVNPTPKPKPIKITIGNDPIDVGPSDGWKSNLVINETDVYTNTSGKEEVLTLSKFFYHAKNTGGPVTPFVVKVNGDDDFVVKAIGSTRVPTVLGAQNHPFLDGATEPTITVAPGEVIAVGFIDALADGTTPPSYSPTGGIVSRKRGADGATDEIFYVADSQIKKIASLTVGEPPTLFSAPRPQNGIRDYAFSVQIVKPSTQNPDVTDPGNQQNNLNDSVNLTIVASDPDGETVQFSATNLPPGLTINEDSGVITGSPTVAGNYVVTITVVDGVGGSTSINLNWAILDPNSPNNAPEITPIDSQVNTRADNVSLQVNATDADNDILEYGATGLPLGLSIDSASGLISGKPTQLGTFNVSIQVTDNRVGGNASDTFDWQIVNSLPVITAPDNQTGEVGDSVNLDVVASDPDGDPLKFSHDGGLPPGLSLNPDTGKISGVLTQAGTFTVKFSAIDDLGGSADKSVTWQVNSPTIETFELGNLVSTVGKTPDGWQSNIVINESDTFVNSSSEDQTLIVTTFKYYASVANTPVTPFVVEVNGDNDFTVVAIGTTRMAPSEGAQTFAFSDAGAPKLTVTPGQILAVGFMDANADGTGGGSSVIPYSDGGDEVWYVGHPTDNGASIVVGQPPTVTATVRDVTRDYAFSITLSEPQNFNLYLPFVGQNVNFSGLPSK